jgi:hypothetical protein
MNNSSLVAYQPDGAKVPHVLVYSLSLRWCPSGRLSIPIIIVITLVSGCPSGMAFNQLREVRRLLGPSDKRVSKQILCSRPFLGVSLQAKFDKVFECFGKVAIQPGWRVFGD